MTVVRRNPAFRVATGGLTVAVLLCLVGAISLLQTTPSTAVFVATETSTAPSPLQVATAGEVSNLLHEHPRKAVPEPIEHPAASEPESDPVHSSTVEVDDLPGPWEPREAGDEPRYVELPPPPQSESSITEIVETAHDTKASTTETGLEAELDRLKGQVNELTRIQLESQLAEIRRAEQLLSAHQTNRLIEELQREVDELKQERMESPSPPVIGDERSHVALATPPEEPLESPAEPIPASVPLVRVRCTETENAPDRFDIEADEASLRELLAVLGPAARWNLVYGSELSGTVTCRWKAVELQQALSQLLRVHGWHIHHEGDLAIVERIPSTAEVNHEPSTGPITLKLAPDSLGMSPPKTETHRHDVALPADEDAETTQPPVPAKSISQSETPSQPGHQQISFGTSSGSSPRRGRIVMKDFLAQMERESRPEVSAPAAPIRIEIEATILQTERAPGSPPRAFRESLSLTGNAVCPRCQQLHVGSACPVGHAADGWMELGDGLCGGVSPLSPHHISELMQQRASTSVMTTPRVQVLSHQMAEIDLTEQQGFRRHSGPREAGHTAADRLNGNVKLALRPTATEDGQIRLDLCPASAQSADFQASLTVPLDSCVVVGGLDFESVPPTESSSTITNGSIEPDTVAPPAKSRYEVVVLIRVRRLID